LHCGAAQKVLRHSNFLLLKYKRRELSDWRKRVLRKTTTTKLAFLRNPLITGEGCQNGTSELSEKQ